MILILCHPHDVEAAWLYERLHQAAPEQPLLIATADELIYAQSIRQTLLGDDDTFLIRLQNGRCIRNDEISVVINRLYHLDPIVWKSVSEKQYQYVGQELNALFLSLLHSVGPDRLFNPPSPVSLGGRHLSSAEWQLLALRVGLPIAPNWPPPETLVINPPDARLLVLAGELLGARPPGIDADACCRLAQVSGTNLLELHFNQRSGEYAGGFEFVGATVFASLPHYGDALVQHLLTLTSHDINLGHTQRAAHPAVAG
ncbi:hypothetical protein BN8_02706 [Fibrisoma limi BUZ 3]|uniref:Uncharacterized protein n=1 Tax=Fibrisoma limi BUZ 3 TaxID=1185876 RepID=I2GI73_9BACT|nr:hypothetical protein [Fibrisoma limi]CCH53598.1 hypothetical protein BN8_02706 [Fibrisoma limi BUZ 3]